MHTSKILYFGERLPLRRSLSALCAHSGHEIADRLPDRAFADIVIDNASVSAVELRARLAALAGRVGHYILISTCRVYAAQPRLRAWREDEIDVCADQFPSLPSDVSAARALERELILAAGAGRFVYSIVRPAWVDTPERDGGLTAWFVRRVLNGGLVVLPEGDLPTYRMVQPHELAGALMTIAGNMRAYGATLNVANQAVLSYWGHAALVRDAFGVPLRFGYVPQWRWRAANLSLPAGETASPGFIEPSGLLAELGWRASDPLQGIFDIARRCREAGGAYTDPVIARERQTLDESRHDGAQHISPADGGLRGASSPQWALRAWAGMPAGMGFERLAHPPMLPSPRLRVKALSLGAPEEKFLKGEYSQSGSRAIGHNAVLEVLNADDSGLPAGTHVLPVAALGCGDAGCAFCNGGADGVLGIGSDGYGWGVCTTPAQHLVPIPADLGYAALLADPLAVLCTALADRLDADRGPVWVAGRTVEALLAAWLAEDAGRPVVRVDWRDWTHDEYPVAAVTRLHDEVQRGIRPASTLAIDFTGNADVAWMMGRALRPGSTLFVRSRPPGIPQGIDWRMLPAAAPDRSSLQRALDILRRWGTVRSLSERIGPAIPIERYWEAWLPRAFSLAYLEDEA